MQTFLPYPNFSKSARILDNKRLGCQRKEAMQILTIILGRAKSKAWRNHPVVKMWRGHAEALKLYLNTIISEWINRGFRNNMQLCKINKKRLKMPCWLGRAKFHKAHRMNLLRKDFEHYSKHFKQDSKQKIGVIDGWSYEWPI